MKTKTFWIAFGACACVLVGMYLVMGITVQVRGSKLKEDIEDLNQNFKGLPMDVGTPEKSAIWKAKKKLLDEEIVNTKTFYKKWNGKLDSYFKDLSPVMSVSGSTTVSPHKVPAPQIYKAAYVDKVSVLKKDMAGIELPGGSPFSDWAARVPQENEIRDAQRKYWIVEFLYQALKQHKAQAIDSLNFGVFCRYGTDLVAHDFIVLPIEITFKMRAEEVNEWIRDVMNAPLSFGIKKITITRQISAQASLDVAPPVEVTASLEVRIFDPMETGG